MRAHFIIGRALSLASVFAVPAVAAQSAPVRELTKSDASSTHAFGSIFGLRQLSGGRVLVNDGVRRQLMVLDATLGNASVLIDSVAVGGQSYGPRAAPLIPYLGDSTLFVDGASLSLLVIDPTGRIAHVMSAPQPNDLRLLASSASGVDRQGNLVYRGAVPRPAQGSRVPTVGSTAPVTSASASDSAPILRANFDTRKVDTVGRVRVPTAARGEMVQGTDGKWMLVTTINPLVTVDDWAVLSNGAIALVRGHDYHVDWVQPDGTTSSSPKLPFDWKRLTDSDKQALIDSARAAQEKQYADMRANGVSIIAASKSAEAFGGGGGSGGGDVGAKLAVLNGGGKGAVDARGGVGESKVRADDVNTRLEFVPLKDIADYYPAIRTGAARADLDGNLWILPTTSAQSKAGELVYDVVGASGQLSYRVRLPVGRSVAGFGRNGVVYLMTRGAAGWSLERAHIVLN